MYNAKKWKKILDEFPQHFVGRSRIDLKDRWRNMNRKKKGLRSIEALAKKLKEKIPVS